jgi:uncharacterized membrane protein YgaE (UPF0421/DUF939 family)
MVALRSLRAHGLRHFLFRERVFGLRMVKTALAAAVAWELAQDLLHSPVPALAGLAAILTVQVTIYESVARALQYALGVVLGVLVAALFVHFLGLHAWTVGVLIFLALALGAALRLGPQAPQVAISALLVISLGVGYGTVRVLDTLLGAAVGVLVNLVIVPPLHLRPAGEALANAAEDAADLLADVGHGAAARATNEQAQEWLRRARRLQAPVQEARDAVARSEQSLRLNPRRWPVAGEAPRATVARRREGLLAIEHVALQVRSLVRTLADRAAEGGEGGLPAMPAPLADLLVTGGAAVAAFGRLLEGAELLGEAEREAAAQELRRAIGGAGELAGRALVEVQEGLAGDPEGLPVYGSVLAEIRRVVQEVDPDGGPHRGAVR